LVEERLKSLFGQAWSDAPRETRLDGPCEGWIERQMKGNENRRPSREVLTWQHANHAVGLAVQGKCLPDCLRPPAEVSLPEAIGEHDNPLGLLARRPVRLVEESSEQRRNPEYVQTTC